MSQQLDQLRGRRRDPAPVEVELTVEAELTRRLSIVGESHYQTELEAVCKSVEGEDVRFECFAELIPEPDNEHDPNASPQHPPARVEPPRQARDPRSLSGRWTAQ